MEMVKAVKGLWEMGMLRKAWEMQKAEKGLGDKDG